MDNLVLIIFVGLSFFMFYLFYFMIQKEKENETKFLAIEKSLDELSRELFILKKSLKEDKDLKELKNMEDIIEKLVNNIKIMEDNFVLKIKELEEKVYSIKKNVKNVEFSNVSGNDEQKIIAMYKSGYSIEDISKELRIPAGEVEFILKMKNIKP